MITIFVVLCLFISVKTSDIEVQTVKIGENVTIKCDQSFVKDKQHNLGWYKQSIGKLPQLVVRLFDYNSKDRYSRPFQQRFRATWNKEEFNLTINKTVEEDAGTYFCVRVKGDVIEFGSGTLLLFSGEKSEKHTLTKVKGGESVTLHCSVQSLSCSEKHTVYWLRHDSEKSQPAIIYTHEDSNSQCTRSSETGSSTQSCVYKLPKKNLSPSDAGTYYCAVAACGEILFGNGTNLNTDANLKWIIPALATFSVISVIVIVVLTVMLYKKQKKGSCSEPPSHTNRAEDTDALNYAALNFTKKPPSSRQSRAQESQDIYSQVKVR
ncbi:uncharacterized protein [Salminus brasiliensis]|uniref:uncharacterized protein n=1 Tax=Salminus brasiliensis TaxID=930266 RepID=UPI003B8349BD